MQKKLICDTYIAKKIVLFILLFLITSSVITINTYGVSPTLLENIQKKVTISMRNATLEQILIEINRQSDVDYGFQSNSKIDKTQLFSLTVTDVTVEEALRTLLNNSAYDYVIDKNRIVITVKDNVSDTKNSFTVNGKVVDEKKNPLPGATVMIKGTSLGTVTNVNGYFNFQLPEMELPITLRFSFIGMDSQEIKYTGQDSVIVTLIENTETLGEVVITGFGEVDKGLSTSAITTLKIDDFLVPGVTSVDQMLEGRVPGMVFMQNSGQVGSTPRLRVRGTSTILGNQEPLWVVDDIIIDDPVDIDINQLNDLDFVNLLGNAISGLNPADIERIDILKDAAATALYGARAGNGVIVVTTKKGEVGPVRVSYNFSSSITRRPYYSDRAMYVMNSQDRVELSRELIENGVKFSDDVFNGLFGYEEAYVNHFKYGKIDNEEFNRLSTFYQTVNTDWFKLLMRNSFSHNHTLGISGGSNSGNYRLSFGYTDEQGAINKEYGKRYTVMINLSSQFKGTTINFKADGSKYDRQYTPSAVGVTTYAYKTSRAIPKYDINGQLWSYLINNAPYNIFTEVDNSQHKVDQKRVGFTFNLKQVLFEFLKLNLTASYNYSFSQDDTWYGESSHYVLSKRASSDKKYHTIPFGGELQTKINKNDSYTLRAQLDFSKFLDSENFHLVFSNLGWEMRSSKYKNSLLTERGYMRERGGMFPKYGSQFDDIKEYENFLAWVVDANTTYSYSLSNTISSYVSASYSYKSKYIFSFNGRVDFSNAFGDRSREKFNPIWSLSGRWNAKKDFFEYSRLINELNFRVSYGLQGNMRNDQPTRLIITRGQFDATVGKNTSIVKHFPNPDLKWEKIHSVNMQMDFSFFNRSISGTLSYFYKKTLDAFYDKPVSDINGITTYVVNKGNIENKGFEISLNINPIPLKIDERGKRGFSWRFDPQLSQTLNRLLNSTIKGNQTFTQEIYSLKEYVEGNAVVEGDPLNTLYSFKFKSLNSQGKPVFYDLEEENANELLKKYEPMSKEEVYRCFLEKSGRRIPIIQGGLSNTFGYRNLVLRFNLSYSFGNKVRLLKLVSGEYSGISPQASQNVRREFKDRWRVPGDEEFKIIPGTERNNTTGNFWFRRGTNAPEWTDDFGIYQAYDYSNIRVVSGDYLRLQSLTLSYQLDRIFLDKLGLSTGSISLSGSNIFTIANKALKGQNPEQSGTSSLINLSIRPRYTVSFNVSF